MVRRLLGRVRPRDLLKAEELDAVATWLAEAEAATSGEIVPVIAARSGRYARAESIIAILFALIVLAVAWALFQDVTAVGGDWSTGNNLRLGLTAVTAIVLASFFAGTYVATQVPALVRPFVSRAERLEEVNRSAAEAFRYFRVGRTAGGTGILIYVSLLERVVTVSGDEPISEKLAQGDWEEVRDAILSGLRVSQPAAGLKSAIEKAGALLATHFPAQPGDVNELRNSLYLVN